MLTLYLCMQFLEYCTSVIIDNICVCCLLHHEVKRNENFLTSYLLHYYVYIPEQIFILYSS